MLGITLQFYLKVGHGDSVNFVLLGLVDSVEQVIECQYHDATVLVCPKHCVGLASPCGGEGGRKEEMKGGRERWREGGRKEEMKGGRERGINGGRRGERDLLNIRNAQIAGLHLTMRRRV